jgi:ribosomal protein L40E
MRDDEKVIAAGPSMEFQEVAVQALRDEAIPARIVAIKDVGPSERPDLACTPGDEFYLVVPTDQHSKAVSVLRWLSRVCLACDATLLPKVRACQKCGTPHLMEPHQYVMHYPNPE